MHQACCAAQDTVWMPGPGSDAPDDGLAAFLRLLDQADERRGALAQGDGLVLERDRGLVFVTPVGVGGMGAFIGRARGQIAIGGASEQEQTLQQILTEMDGFTGREGIIVLAATNQPDVLDRALLRPGRFDRRVVVNLPDKPGREAILKVHVRKVPLAGDVSLDELAQATPGFSGADLKNLVNEAALLAARRAESEVHQKDFLDALEKIVLGPERPLLLSPEDKPEDHLDAMEAIFGNLSQETFRRFLRQADSVEDVLTLLEEADARATMR